MSISSSVKGHWRRMTLHFRVWYPEHEQRKVSPLFRATRKQVLDVEKRGCHICGTRDNLEVHHFYIEWALANRVDWQEFLTKYPQFSKHQNVDDFVDSVDNAMVLCTKHHRRKGHGIHTMDFPEWEIQGFSKDLPQKDEVYSAIVEATKK